MSEKIKCAVCNKILSRRNYSRHEVSKFHIENLKEFDGEWLFQFYDKNNVLIDEDTGPDDIEQERIINEYNNFIEKMDNLVRH